MVYEHVASLIKAHVPNLEKAYSAIDIDNLKEDECHDQDLSALLSNLRRPHTSFMVINAPGSNTLKTVSAYCKREKIKVVEPNAQKYRDTHTFIESLNDSLIRCLKHNDYTLILIKDSILNDIGYIDYIVNLTIAFKDTAYFNSLDCLIGS